MAELNERSEQIGAGITVYTSPPHTFNEDSMLLASFARAERAGRACDLGTGCGIIPLMWCRRARPDSITAVDFSERACALARRGVEESGLLDRVKVVCADIREFWRTVRRRYDLVTMNPPYYRAGSGRPNRSAEEDAARRDSAADINTVCRCAARVLNQGGRLCICFPTERLCDAVAAMRASRLEPKRMRPVASCPGREPRLMLIEAVLGGGPGLRMETTLFSCDGDGRRTSEMENFLNGGTE